MSAPAATSTSSSRAARIPPAAANSPAFFYNNTSHEPQEEAVKKSHHRHRRRHGAATESTFSNVTPSSHHLHMNGKHEHAPVRTSGAGAAKSEHKKRGSRRQPAEEETKASDAASSMPCIVCGEDIPTDSVFYECKRSAEHSQCVTCFGDYVRHCCDNYFAGKFPLTCPLPACRERVPDATLRRLLAIAPNSKLGLWTQYERAQLQAALMQTEMRAGEVAVTCFKCNAYVEIFPKDYQERAHRLIKALRAWQLEQARKLEEREREEAKRKAQAQAQAEKKTEKWNGKSSTAGSSANSSRKQDPLHNPANSKSSQAGDGLGVLPIKRHVSIERFRPENDPAINMTSQFFNCRTPQCGASVCLRCNAFLDAKEQLHHVCRVDRVMEVYLEVLEILANAATRKCPKCGRVGRKDYSCNHITCDPPCQTRWCYPCGKAFSDFSEHNKWDLSYPKNSCPMYLQYMLGDNYLPQHGRYDGDPRVALERFHMLEQIPLVEAYRQQVNDEALWQEMMKKRFPNGIWDAHEMEAVEQIKKQSKEWAEKKQKDEEEKRAADASAEAARLAELERAAAQAVAQPMAGQQQAENSSLQQNEEAAAAAAAAASAAAAMRQ